MELLSTACIIIHIAQTATPFVNSPCLSLHRCGKDEAQARAAEKSEDYGGDLHTEMGSLELGKRTQCITVWI